MGTDGVCLDVNMVGTWMDALWERMESVWTLTWLAHGCCVGTDGVCLDVTLVGTRMLCGDGWSLCGH